MFIPSGKPTFSQDDIREITNHVERILKSSMLTLHNYTKLFEEKFAALCSTKYAVAVNSGTAALEVALRCLNIRSGNEVIVPTNTFIATATAIIFAGGKPVLTDINPKTLCVDVKNIQEKITAKTKGVIVVHIGGIVCPDIREICELCEDYKLFLIEDAAHAHGSKLLDKPAGSFGDVACFSFYPTKVMTSGEGGLITTNREDINRKARILRDQGKENFASNTIIELGYNWRLPEISAAIGVIQLKRLQEFIKRRRTIAAFYNDKLKNVDGIIPIEIPSQVFSNYYKYIVFLDEGFDRELLKRKLRDEGVKCSGEVYWPPLHMQPVFQRIFGYKEGEFSNAENVCKRMLCLPIYNDMSDEDAEYVISKIIEMLPKCKC